MRHAIPNTPRSSGRRRPTAAAALVIAAAAMLVVWLRRDAGAPAPDGAPSSQLESARAGPLRASSSAPVAADSRQFLAELERIDFSVPGYVEAIRATLAEWLASDMEAAWRWAVLQRDHFDESGMISPLAQAARHIVALDVERAVALVRRELAVGTPAEAGRAAQAVVDALIRAGMDDQARRAIENWLTASDAARLGHAPIDTAAAAIAKRSPLDAAMWLESLPVSPERNIALGALATHWAGSAPAEALTWAKTLPESASRDDVLLRGFSRWLERDIEGVTRWFAAHEADPAADRMIVNVLRDTGFGLSVPHVAFRWTELIADPAVRRQQMEEVTGAWAFRDHDAASRYIAQNSKLTPAEKTRLLEIAAARRQPRSAGAP